MNSILNNSNTKYLTRINLLTDLFNKSINIPPPLARENHIDAYEILLNMRTLHGFILYKYHKIIKKYPKKYLLISRTFSVINTINDKISESELSFNSYISKNQQIIPNSSIDKFNVSNNNQQIISKLPEKSDNLPLFNGKKSVSISNTSSNELIFNNNIASLLFFYNPGCPACVSSKPHWDKLTNNLKKAFKKNKTLFNIKEINLADTNNEHLATLFQIQYIPTVVMIESSNKPTPKIKKIEGMFDKEKINSFIKESFDLFST